MGWKKCIFPYEAIWKIRTNEAVSDRQPTQDVVRGSKQENYRHVQGRRMSIVESKRLAARTKPNKKMYKNSIIPTCKTFNFLEKSRKNTVFVIFNYFIICGYPEKFGNRITKCTPTNGFSLCYSLTLCAKSWLMPRGIKTLQNILTKFVHFMNVRV